MRLYSDSDMETVEDVERQGLCTMCGTCAGVCPTSAISMYINEDGLYSPRVRANSCIKCKLCLRVCPGLGIRVQAIREPKVAGGQKETIVQRLLGDVTGCYVGSANDSDIRLQATSGGLVTGLLCYLLDNDLVDGALVTKADPDNPIHTRSFIARTSADIRGASTSKYCPTTPNVALKHVLDTPGRYAVVGLPCQIHGIRKAERINEKLKRRIILHLGLLCSGTHSYNATTLYLSSIGIPIHVIRNFRYRVGWPSNIIIDLTDGTQIKRRAKASYFANIMSKRFFLPIRCSLCFDLMNELADISFGDARFDDAHLGQSIIITRNKFADTLLKEATQRLRISPITALDVIDPSRGILAFKKRTIKARLHIMQLLKKSVPYGDDAFFSPTLIDYGKGLIYFVHHFVGSKKRLWKFIPSLISLQNLVYQTRAR